MGWSALDDRDTELGLETRLNGLVSGFVSGLSGVEEASGASLSARSLELMLSMRERKNDCCL